MKNKDFKKYYCQKLKRHIWVLGYFGGGSINFRDFYDIALEFSQENNVDIESINIDEILSSRRFKGFKFIFSKQEGQVAAEGRDNNMLDVFNWLHS